MWFRKHLSPYVFIAILAVNAGGVMLTFGLLVPASADIPPWLGLINAWLIIGLALLATMAMDRAWGGIRKRTLRKS